MSYVFKSGKFKGKSIAQLYLTRYPELVNFIKWARDKPNLSGAVLSFDSLNSKITNVKLIAEHCFYRDCSNPAPYMSVVRASTGELVPDPYFWCERHKPWEDVKKEPISIQASTRFTHEYDQRLFLKTLCNNIGIQRVTKRVAEDFFNSI